MILDGKKMPIRLILLLSLFLFSCQKADNSLIILYWPGVDYNKLNSQVNSLPNIKKLIQKGSLLKTQLTEDKTEDLPIISQSLTGKDSSITGIYSNAFYSAIDSKNFFFSEEFKKKKFRFFYYGNGGESLGQLGKHTLCLGNSLYAHHVDHLINKNDCLKNQMDRKGQIFSKIPTNQLIGQTFLNDKKDILNRVSSLKAPYIGIISLRDFDQAFHAKENKTVLLNKLKGLDEFLGEILKINSNIVIIGGHGIDDDGPFHRYAPWGFFVTPQKIDKSEIKIKDISPFLSSLYYQQDLKTPVRPKPEVIKIGYFHGGRTLLLHRALSNRYFLDHGIDLKLVTKTLYGKEYKIFPSHYLEIRNQKTFGKAKGDELWALVKNDKVHGATIGETSFLKMIHRGEDIVAVAELGRDLEEKPGHGIYIQKNINIKNSASWNGLRLVSRRSSGGDSIFFREFLAQEGVDLNKVELFEDQPEDIQEGGFIEGKFHGGYFHLLAMQKMWKKKQGKLYRKLDWVNAELSQSLLVFPRKYIKENRDLIKRLLKGYVQRVRFEHQIPKALRLDRYMRGKTGLRMEVDFLGLNYPQYRKEPLVRPELLKEMNRLGKKHKILPANQIEIESFIDNSLMKEVLESIK